MGSEFTRRTFFGTVAATGAALTAHTEELEGARPAAAGSPAKRSRDAYNIRVDAARFQRDQPIPAQRTNGDESRYASKVGSYTKGLPHDGSGQVDLKAFDAFTQALNSGSQAELDQVPMGASTPSQQRKFVNPCCGIDFNLQGIDSHHMSIAPAPAFASAEAAGEMVELYWAALARDVPFTQYASSGLTQAAADDLSQLSDFRGPKVNGKVATATLFRGFTAGDAVGPHISQFLLKPVPFGSEYVEHRMHTLLPGNDYLMNYQDWLNAQNGNKPTQSARFDSTRRFIRNGRDLAQWVHVDVLYQAYFNAMLIMLQPPDPSDALIGGGMGAPLNPGNPYLKSLTQEGFGTFGAPGIAAAVADIATNALKAVWYQKWFVHRRLRPEAYGGAVHLTLTKSQSYPVHSDLTNSSVLGRLHGITQSYLLPIAFPEGSPLHPSYGAGHATVAGACVTILKALFDESYPVSNPVVASDDGTTLVPYTGSDAGALTVGGELNKLASNIAIGRNIAGVHWRSDYTESLKLGEAVAIGVLRDQKLTYGEAFDGYQFTRFNGTKITV